MARRIVCLLIALSLAGCGANYAVYAAGTGVGGGAVAVAPAATTIVSDGGLTATISLGATAASVVFGIGLVSLLMAGNNISPIPPVPMRADREVNAQSCTAPVASFTANLKCQ